MSGVTEVPAGAYAIMDLRYREYRTEFRPAARVMCTVTSHPEPGKAMTDAGEKAVGSNHGPPEVDGIPGASATSLDAEHGRLDLEGQAQESVDLGDKVWFVPSDAATCFNLHDYVSAVRDGRLETVWPVSARGRYR
jgi:3-hydroxy-D-aspartate aldolase